MNFKFKFYQIIFFNLKFEETEFNIFLNIFCNSFIFYHLKLKDFFTMVKKDFKLFMKL
jgi:hypothetical protein